MDECKEIGLQLEIIDDDTRKLRHFLSANGRDPAYNSVVSELRSEIRSFERKALASPPTFEQAIALFFQEDERNAHNKTRPRGHDHALVATERPTGRGGARNRVTRQ